MKSEHTVFNEEDSRLNEERTISDNENTVLNDNAEQTDEKLESTDNQQSKGSNWRRAGIGMGMGILLGTTTSFVTTGAAIAENNANIDENDESGNTAHQEGEVPWADADIQVATSVNDEMSFSEAFAAARHEVGAGGAFEWRGNVYGTYYADEWNNMTQEQKDEYNQHFSWNNHSSSQQTESQAEAEAVHADAVEAQTAETVGTVENTEAEPVQADLVDNGPEVEILGVVQNEELGQVGLMTVDDQEVILVDVDMDNNFDVAVCDINQDQIISDNEIQDISQYEMSVSEFEAQSIMGAGATYAETDNTDDGMDVGLYM